ncbi:Fe-S protein assembly co-chaperone HscB [Psittacicella hinzii]|nr:Fe-S protein assembly co-chaperone HscB [Psittacicella hinzii]
MFNPFAILGLDEDFVLDSAKLENNYLELMKQYHPDKIAAQGDDSKQKLEITLKSQQINDAYNIVKDDIKRAQALIDLKKQQAHFDETIAKKDNEFIFTQLEMREAVANLAQIYDESKMAAIKQKALDDKQQNLQALTQALAEQNLELAQKLVYRLQFLSKLQTDIATVEEDQLFA